MLKELNVDQAHFVALLAEAARAQRDEWLGNVAEQDVGEVNPARGEHNPTKTLGFDPDTARDAQATALRDAIATLSETARGELYTLMRIGQGHLAAKTWHRGVSEAKALGEKIVTAVMMEDPDLHDHITKGLYESKLVA